MSGFDLILSDGQVIDGTGAPARGGRRHRDDRIAAIGDLSAAPGGVAPDISGLAIAPGFIDAHTHDDLALLHCRRCLQGQPGRDNRDRRQLRHQPGPAPTQNRHYVLPRPLDLLGDVLVLFPGFGGSTCTLLDAAIRHH